MVVRPLGIKLAGVLLNVVVRQDASALWQTHKDARMTIRLRHQKDCEFGVIEVPDVRQIGDRCRDLVMALTPHPTTRVNKCRAACTAVRSCHSTADVHAGAGTLTSQRAGQRQQVFADFDQWMLWEACDDPRKGTLRKSRAPKLSGSHDRVRC